MKRFILIYLPIICIAIAAIAKLKLTESIDALPKEYESSANFDPITKDNSIKSTEKKSDSQLHALQEQIEELNDKVNDLEDENNELNQEVRKERAAAQPTEDELRAQERQSNNKDVSKTEERNDLKENSRSKAADNAPVSTSYVPKYYKYKTSLNSNVKSHVILQKPKSSGRILYTLHYKYPVYVIERTNSKYYRVVIDGKRGYISKYSLNQK